MKQQKLSFVSVVVVLALFLAFTAIPIAAQESTGLTATKQEPAPSLKGDNPTLGGTNSTYYTVAGVNCHPLSSGMGWSTSTTNQGLSMYCTSGICIFYCPVNLPSGVEVQSISLNSCDNSTSAEINASLISMDKAGVSTTMGTVHTGGTEANGCQDLWSDTTNLDNINNMTRLYYVQVLTGIGDTTTFQRITLEYKFQPVPAPSVATFSDVPTSHIFFQYVEALVESGITSGCTTDLYCPNNYVTRAQMAAFLSKALGLGWPN